MGPIAIKAPSGAQAAARRFSLEEQRCCTPPNNNPLPVFLKEVSLALLMAGTGPEGTHCVFCAACVEAMYRRPGRVSVSTKLPA